MPPNGEAGAGNTQQFEELKKIIRSIVIPYKDGTKIGTLISDYKEIEGRDIAYRDLGFRSLHHLLQAMPDVVRFQYNKNNDYVLFPVMDEATGHIQTMVKEQMSHKGRRPNTSSRLMSIHRNRNHFVPRPPLLSTPMMRYNAPMIPFATLRPQLINNHMPFSLNQSFIPLSGNHTLPPPNSRPILGHYTPVAESQACGAVPRFVQNNISIMLNKFQCGLHLKDFLSFYIHDFKSTLDFQSYGFNSLEQCLKSLTDICYVNDDGMVDVRKPLMAATGIPNGVPFQVTPNLSKVSTRPKITRTASVVDSYGQTNGIIKVTATTTTVTMTSQQATFTVSSTTVTTITTAVTRTKPVTVQSTPSCKQSYDWNSWLQAKDSESEAKMKKAVTYSGGGDLKVTLSNPSVNVSEGRDIAEKNGTVITGAASNELMPSTSTTTMSRKADTVDANPKGIVSKLAMKMLIAKKAQSTDEVVQKQSPMLITVENKKSGQSSRSVTNCDNSVKGEVRQQTNVQQKIVSSAALVSNQKIVSKSDLTEPVSDNLWPTASLQTSASNSRLKPAGSQVSLLEPSTSRMENKSRSKVEDWLRKNEDLKRGNELLIQNAEATVNSKEIGILLNPAINDTEKFPPQVISAFKRLIAKHQSGIPATEFVRQYELELGFEMNSLALGFTTPIQVFYALPSVFVITPPDIANEMLFEGSETEHILYDATNVPKEVEDILKNGVTRKRRIPSGTQVPVGGVIDEKIKLRVLKLLQIMNEGITVADFPSVYSLNFREEIYPSRMRYESFLDFFCALSFELPLSVRAGSQPKVFLESQLFADWFKLCISEQRYSALKMFDCPSDAVLPGETLDSVEIPADLIMSENERKEQLSWVPTLITSAISPHSFWIHIQGKEYSEAVITLMAELEFYNRPESEEYRVPDEFIMKGLFCVAKFPGDNQWHRARVARLQASERVTVYFIDYGGLAIINRRELRLLKRQFFSLKQQAIHVSLKGIKPAADGNVDKWSFKARQKLLEFSNKDYWLATLFYPKITATKYEVYICDTNGEEDVYINEALLEEKVAVKQNSESVREREDDSMTTASTTISNISLAKKVRQFASKGKHLDSIKKKLKNVRKSNEPLLRDILEIEKNLNCENWDVDNVNVNHLYSTNNTSSPASTLFSSQQQFAGNEDALSLGRIKHRSHVVNIFSIDYEIFVLASQIDNLLKDSSVWKYIAETSFELEEVILDDNREDILKHVNLSEYALPGVKLYKMKGILQKLDDLSRINERSEFQQFFQSYLTKYAGTSDKQKLRLLQSVEALMLPRNMCH